ncbi:DsbA family protein [Lysinibacillus xylanilyticus]|uniref:DsbA family protein n=1 Tax=Lysinibacillus xylanilyticus TaxID=582475 RepID=UPI0036DC7D02
MFKRIIILFSITVAIFLVLITASYIIHQIRLSKEDKLFTPTGKMVEVNGHQMHVYVEGNGEETLVFMSGGGTSSPVLDFKSLYSLLSDKYKIAVVEKAGYGFSDITDSEPNIDTILQETREALLKSGVEGPYILAPPSRVFKVIQKHNGEIANVFLRRAREAVFVFNQNIAEDSVLIGIVNNLGLDGEKIVKEAELPIGQQLLTEDFALASQLGVRGFPTIIMLNEENKGVKIVGSRTLDSYTSGLKQVLNLDELQPKQQPALFSLLEKEKLLFSKEIEVMYDIEQKDINRFVESELSAIVYDTKQILGEAYFINK